MWDAAKYVSRRVVNTAKNIITGNVIRDNYPPYIRTLLQKIGDVPITEMSIRCDPIQSMLNTVFNLITLGKWNTARKRYSYDKLFHLGLEVVVNGERYVIEKNEVINVAPAKPHTNTTEIMNVPYNGSHTINSLLDGGKRILGNNYFKYDAFKNNCQDFIIAILTGNNIGNQSVYGFVKQPLENLLKELPSYTDKVAKAITDMGGVFNTALYGEGKRGMKERLLSEGLDADKYLRDVRGLAKKAGYDPKALDFSQGATKLFYTTPSGKKVAFGATANGDYLYWKQAKPEIAEAKRRGYLARATKIKGDWKSDKYSKNNLAIRILWAG
jgi:hypothetical protein